MNRLDVLIHRHLEGEIDDAEAAELGQRLKADPDARRRMAEMAFDAVSLRDALSKRPASRGRKLPLVPLAAAAAVFLVVTSVVLLAPGPATAPPTAPPQPPAAPRAERFSGSVIGTVAGRSEGSFRLGVIGSSGHPLVGRTIFVAPGFARSDAGDLMPSKIHAAFIRRLADGQELEVDLRQVDGDVFVIGELTKEQSDWAMKRGDAKKPKPEREGDRKDGDKEK